MINFNHQLPKQERTCAMASVSFIASWPFEGYNTPSIRGLNDQGQPGGFIEGSGYA